MNGMFAKAVVLEADNKDEALNSVKAAVETGLIKITPDDLIRRFVEFEDEDDPLDPESTEEFIKEAESFVSEYQDYLSVREELENEIESRTDLSGKFVVDIRAEAERIVQIKATNSEEAVNSAKHQFETGSLALTPDDIVNGDECSFEYDVMRLEAALELEEFDEEELFPFSTKTQTIEEDA